MKADSAIHTAFEDVQHRDTAIGERNLMRAILRTAFEDLRKRGDAYRQARHYLLSDDEFYLYSFMSICNHLRICPFTVRRRLGLIGEPLENAVAAAGEQANPSEERMAA